MKFFATIFFLAFASEKNTNTTANPGKNFAGDQILVKIEEDEIAKANTAKYFGTRYHRNTSKWQARRWSTKEKKHVLNGYHKDEETAACASDTLARELIANGEHHELNFPDENIEVHAEEKIKTSKYIGVCYDKYKNHLKWRAMRFSKKENKNVHNGSYKDAKTAAHASDTLARQLMAKDRQNLKLNFPDDKTDVYPEERTTASNFIGVSYYANQRKWVAYRWNKQEKKLVHGGCFKDEKAAACQSDTLARKLIANGELHHKLNFPNASNNARKCKRKRKDDLGGSQIDAKFSAK